MILAADIGNSRITLRGYAPDGSSPFSAHFTTDRRRDGEEYRLLLTAALREAGIPRAALDGCVLCSVVPTLTETFGQVLAALTGKEPVTLRPGTKTGLLLRAESQAEVGADIVAGLVGGEALLGAPLLTLDLGTATTVAALNEKKEFFGVAILPGLGLGSAALARSAALLPEVSLDTPKEPLCRNTRDAVCAGAVLGHACMLDGYLSLVAERYFDGTLPPVAITGGDAARVLPYLRHPARYLPTLVCDGLFRIYEKNRRG